MPNRLIDEKSPYLLQHAHNPVQWYPWGEDAFERARREDKPVFLSIGYSTCHWCHVMERESFANPTIADLMNDNFVCIKVDREERPDVDKIYMTAVQAMTGSGGWPLSAWLTPDLKPFFGGTYFPPEPRWGRISFPDLLNRIASAWKNDREALLQSADRVGEFLVQASAPESEGTALSPELLDKAYQALEARFDSELGGFGGPPKFPMPVYQHFLLRSWARTGNQKALDMVLLTLRQMARGGIRDHIGGGFHRYSTDGLWHVPHFEKMLYDNAQIAVNYVEAYQASHDPAFAAAARETLDYVLRDLTHPEGGFYSAEDADSAPFPFAAPPESASGALAPPVLAGGRGAANRVSPQEPAPSAGEHAEKEEGAFYVWEKDEILTVLGPEAGEIASFYFGVEPGGNARDPMGEFQGKNILFIAHSVADTAQRFGKTEAEARQILDGARQKLFEARAGRPRPHRDDKVLTSWNGLMISALARASQALDEPAYLKAGERAALFMQTRLYDAGQRRLYRRWRNHERKVPGIADDYAFLVQGLLDLYEASFNVQWLAWAMDLTETQNELFSDRAAGGFFMTAADHDPRLLVRVKEDTDNVEPCASSVAAANLLRLSQLTGREDFRQMAEKTLTFFSGLMARQPTALPSMLAALDIHLSPATHIVIAGDRAAPDTREMLRRVHDRFLPRKVLLLADADPPPLAEPLPFLKEVRRVDGKATAYVCVDAACGLPTTDLRAFEDALDRQAKAVPGRT
jgi:uncharacterized protein